jgi:1,6-anhydro-N-acetylmuramate kinase
VPVIEITRGNVNLANLKAMKQKEERRTTTTKPAHQRVIMKGTDTRTVKEREKNAIAANEAEMKEEKAMEKAVTEAVIEAVREVAKNADVKDIRRVGKHRDAVKKKQNGQKRESSMKLGK